VPDAVVLHDPDGHLARPYRPVVLSATAADVREWTLLGWCALADATKYLRRRSVWEALSRLEEARGLALRLWAAGQGVDYPLFRLTSLLDDPTATLPASLDATSARADWDEVRRAVVACAELLDRATGAARAALGSGEPTPMAAYVRGRLAAIAPAPVRDEPIKEGSHGRESDHTELRG
jgi:hypothetical protein